MSFMDSANQLFGGLGGLIGLFLFACVITLTIYWLIFPWLKVKKANEIIAELRRLGNLMHNLNREEPLPPPLTLDEPTK